MSLEQILKVAVERIRSGSLENEAQVKQAIILPILRALDWEDTNPAEFKPEFSVGRGRVDYALLTEGGGPLVFIEAKGIGRVDIAGEEQLFGYAVNKGVPFLILTDGDLWDFYLSMAAGDPAERRFYRAELTREERIPEYARFLDAHLRKTRVVSGEARRSAERRHESNREREKAHRAIPGAWQTLLNTPDEMLCDLLAEEVERACGTRPEMDDVVSFLQARFSEALPGATSVASPAPPPRSRNSTSRTQTRERTRITGFIFEGERFETGSAKQTLAEVLKLFQHRDSGFMQRFAAQTVGRRRQLVARNRNELYPGRSDLLDNHSLDLGNGWWLGTNISAARVRKNVEIACRIAGVNFGTQLRLIES